MAVLSNIYTVVAELFNKYYLKKNVTMITMTGYLKLPTKSFAAEFGMQRQSGGWCRHREGKAELYPYHSNKH